MPSEIIERLTKDPEMRDLMDRLGDGLSSSDLQSVLIETARRRSLKIRPSSLLKELSDNRFQKPSDIPQSAFIRLDRIAYENVPERFIPLELSPVTPLGSISSLSNLSQNLTVSTVRHSEVVSDPTNVMAIEAALRRKALLHEDPGTSEPVKLCTSHRLLRGQAFENDKFTAHFRVFSLVTAGRDTGHSRFEIQQLEEHIRFYLRYSRSLGIIKGSELSLSDFSGDFRSDLLDPVLEKLRHEYPETSFGWDNARSQAKNYYSPLAFRIRYFDEGGQGWDLVDGGFTGWTQTLLNNRKERYLGSAIGTELLLRVFPEAGSDVHSEQEPG